MSKKIYHGGCVNGSKIYHGGCVNCVAQNFYGKNYCKKCQYRKPNWSLSDLSITDEKDIKKILRKLKLQKINDGLSR